MLDEQAGPIYTAWAQVTAELPEPMGWRGDLARAGGGVLLHGAYEQLDLLVDRLGTPESVFAQGSSSIPPGKARSYDTEDACQVSLRFLGGRIATLDAVRRAGPGAWKVRLVGGRRWMEVTGEGLDVRDPAGDLVDHLPVRSGHRYGAALASYGGALRAGLRNLPSTAADHLPTLAVVEAAYLSMRTGQAESPARFLRQPSKL
jgi:predicted dehydrogenase